MVEILYWIWISRIKKVQNKTLLKLLEKYKLPNQIYELSYYELLKNQVKEFEIVEILKKEYRDNLQDYYDYMVKNNIDIIPINNKYYPEKLKNIEDKPIVIYTKGNKEILNKTSIAIIGCRNASEYGIKVAEKMAYNLCQNNINIVSGLARGIDSYAHIGAIQAKVAKQQTGTTIAVIGNGIDNVYPSINKKLANEIIRTGGVIVSEYIVGTKAERINFPVRNRIVSALSNGVLVIEAAEKSGTLITVDFALEQGKDVFAIPGNITNNNSIGTNNLLKQGAILVTSYKDVLYNINTYNKYEKIS